MAARRPNRAWVIYVLAAVGLLCAYVIAWLTAAPGVGDIVFDTAIVTGLAGLLVGIRLHRPASRWPWMLAGGMVLAVIGGLLPPTLPMGGTAPPGMTDVFFLSSYAILALTLFHIVRRRTPGRDLPALLDVGIITVSASLLSWVYVIAPLFAETDLDPATRLISAAYPLSDLMLAALGARLLMGDEPKSPAVYSLTGYLALIIIPDTLSVVLMISGNNAGHGLTHLLWMASALLLGLIGLHPSMRELDAPIAMAAPDVGSLRLAVLALASLLAPATLMIQHVRQAPLHVPLISACCGLLFLLVTGRLSGLVAAQRRLAVTDELTGLHTRRHFRDRLSIATRARESTAVVLLDIDHFKTVNDTYGHDGGDRVLREIANRLTQAVRSGDVVARYGGEEFAILLPHTSPEQARTVADRVHAAIRETPIHVSPTVAITVTVSAGVASMPTDVTEPDQLTLHADELLYRAKNAGRDRVVSTAAQR